MFPQQRYMSFINYLIRIETFSLSAEGLDPSVSYQAHRDRYFRPGKLGPRQSSWVHHFSKCLWLRIITPSR